MHNGFFPGFWCRCENMSRQNYQSQKWYFVWNYQELFIKSELCTRSWLIIGHFWWTILDNYAQNIIFTADNFDSTCFYGETKNPLTVNCGRIFSSRMFFIEYLNISREVYSRQRWKEKYFWNCQRPRVHSSYIFSQKRHI